MNEIWVKCMKCGYQQHIVHEQDVPFAVDGKCPNCDGDEMMLNMNTDQPEWWTKEAIMDSRFKAYRKKSVQMMRPYVPGEDLTGVSVNKEDTPEDGGMIAVNANNPSDQWYVAKKFFEDNYVVVT